MGTLAKLYRGRNDFDFPKIFRPMLIISAVLVVVSVVSLFTRGLNLSIDFQGGASWEIPSKTLTTAQATEVLTGFKLNDGSKVQEAKNATGKRIVRVQADTKSVAKSREVAKAFADKANLSVDEVATNTVGPSWGSEITRQAGISLIVFLIVIALYITFLLEWSMAVAALIAVAHDIIITVGVYSVFGFEVTPATVISFLTILGYSLYDTIVVYERVSENTVRYDRTERYTYSAIMRRSLNQVLMRSINTTLVALMPVVSMLVIGAVLLGQTTIRDFALALFVGLLSGAYSSIFIASPVVVMIKERQPKYRRIRQRAIDRKQLEQAEHVPLVDAVLSTVPPSSLTADGSEPTAKMVQASQYARPHPPRPRKQGKKR